MTLNGRGLGAGAWAFVSGRSYQSECAIPDAHAEEQIRRAFKGHRFDEATIDLAWRSMAVPLAPECRKWVHTIGGGPMRLQSDGASLVNNPVMIAGPVEMSGPQMREAGASYARVDLSHVDPLESPSVAREVLADRLEELGVRWVSRFLRPRPVGTDGAARGPLGMWPALGMWDAWRQTVINQVLAHAADPEAVRRRRSEAIRGYRYVVQT